VDAGETKNDLYLTTGMPPVFLTRFSIGLIIELLGAHVTKHLGGAKIVHI